MLSIPLAEHQDQFILPHRFRSLDECLPVSPSAAHCVEGEFLFIGHDAEIGVTSDGDVSDSFIALLADLSKADRPMPWGESLVWTSYDISTKFRPDWRALAAATE